MKKLLALLLTVTMLCGTAITAIAENKDYPQRFYDVPKDHWAFEYIAELVDRGVIAGYEDGSFKPNNTVTRAEFAKIMVCAASVPTTDNNVYFTDMVGHWAIPYVNAARNYLTAYSDNTYRPNQAAVREDVTMAMVRLKGYDVSNVDFSYLSGFTDTDSISNNVKAYVAVAVEKGLISGFEDNTFRGQGTLTRAEAATLLWKAFQYGNDNKVTDTSANQQSVSQTTPIVTPQTTIPQTTPTQNTVVSTPTTAPITETTQPVATEKPYKVDTLAKTSSKLSSNKIAYDGKGTLYFVEDNKVFAVTSSDKYEVFDGATLTTESDFDVNTVNISSICCDDKGNLIVSIPKTFYGDKVTSEELYKVNNGSLEYMNGVGNQTLLHSSARFISGENYVDAIGNVGRFGSEERTEITYPFISAVAYNNNLIIAGESEILEYDYNNTTKIANSYGVVGLSNSGYVIEKDGAFIIRTFEGDEISRFALDDCEVVDSTPLTASHFSSTMYLTTNNAVIFYDTNAKAFRIISENK